ncbi:hypothetical protein O181_096733, partial [Austropuccinia psidii MF-1]|nr:hypothetical protein [Austropuccinia psidii MF-1]
EHQISRLDLSFYPHPTKSKTSSPFMTAMKILEKLDVGAKTWYANPSTRSMELTRQSSMLRRQPSVSKMDHPNRKLKEQRLAELENKLDSSHFYPQRSHQQHHRASSPFSQSVQKLDDISNKTPILSPQQELEIWEEKRREAEELNARIESLRLSGMPADRLPSPVHFPSTPTLKSSLSTSSSFNASKASSSTAVVSENRLKSQSSKKSLRSSLPHPQKSPALTADIKANNMSQTIVDNAQMSYFKALKEAEDLISQLRMSHDDLLVRVKELENQVDSAELEKRDLTSRVGKLEQYLEQAETSKERLIIENEQLKIQLNDQARAQALNQSQSHTQAQVQAMHQRNESGVPSQADLRTQAHQQAPYKSPSARLRAQLQERDLYLQRQLSHPTRNLAFSSEPSGLAQYNALNQRARGTPLTHGVFPSNGYLQQQPIRQYSTPLHHHPNLGAQIYDEKLLHSNNLNHTQGLYGYH